MDNPEQMKQDQQNLGSSSSSPNKRKRGRPRKEEGQTKQQVSPPATTIEESLLGKGVCGVVEGSFEAGYFLNVKVAGTENQLKGVVFLPDKVTPVTPTTDLFPQVKMYAREDIPIPFVNQQTPPLEKKVVTDGIASETQTDNLIAGKNQSVTLPDDYPVSDAVKNHPVDTVMKDVAGSSAEDNSILRSEACAASTTAGTMVPGSSAEDNTILRSEACAASKRAGTMVAGSSAEDNTILKSEACAASKTSGTMVAGSSAEDNTTLSLELCLNKTKRSGTEEEKCAADDTPDELKLELGNKKISDSTKMEFLRNLFGGIQEAAKEEPEKANAGSDDK